MFLKSISTIGAGFIALLCQSSPALAITIDDLLPQLLPAVGTPMTMLNLSRDHQLTYKAYNEYSDLNGDGVPERTYLHSYTYYGYFDSNKCYEYVAGSNQFEAVTGASTVGNFCSGSTWNGNFLNWSTMTRIDVVRKILYGGLRSVDQTNQTVLERSFLPTDAHAFAKYYDGSGGATINQLTPIAAAPNGITICNATITSGGGGNRYSQTNTNRPLMRVARGNFSLWNSNERWQCYWNEERAASNGNNPAVTGLPAAGNNPSRAAVGTGAGLGDYAVRVRVCDESRGLALTTDEIARCRQYSTGSRKPIGLLHTYGESNQSEFGLITGSYSRNISGGVLRRNVTSFSTEVNFTTDGTFTNVQGIVYNINRIRPYGYDYNDGTYIGQDNCSYQRIGIGTGGAFAVPEGSCSSWGNPIGTQFLEALRYFSGAAAATPAFLPPAGSKDSQLGLTSEPFRDPFRQNNTAIYGEAVCRPINIINFNASVNSYDADITKWAGFSALNGAPNISTLTDDIGRLEGLYAGGTRWFVGNAGTGGAANNNNLCTAKTLTSLASVTGVCPEAPTFYGSYRLAAAALYAHTTPIRTDFPIPAGNTSAFRVNTYSVALSTGVPTIETEVNGRKVVIQPSYRLNLGGANVGAGTLVDFRIVSEVRTPPPANKLIGGSYVVQWEDSEQGGDYDQDVWGLMGFSIAGNQITVSTQVIGAASGNQQGMGFVISGTDTGDGPHYQGGAYGLVYNDPNPPNAFAGANLNATGGCNNCNAGDGVKTATFNVTGAATAGASLRDPLFYAAKYGKFEGTYTPGVALSPAQWDTKQTNGNPGGDGTPDAYFFAVNPAQLEESIRSILSQLVTSGGTAPAVTGSRVSAGGQIFLTTYTNTTTDFGRGDISAYTVDQFGTQAATPNWTAASQLTARGPGSRTIITNNGGVGRPFQWSNTNLSTAQRLALNTTVTNFVDTRGPDRLAYLRGDRSNETAAGFFRRRIELLGDIINSTPWYVAAPNGAYSDVSYPGYRAFLAANLGRTPVVYVGANDGLLHGFNATTGAEVLGFVPNAVYKNLVKLTDPAYTTRTFVDGALFAGDANVGGWKTFLVGSLGRGGQGIFALDVTNPAAFSEGNANNIFKWEFSEEDDRDFGNFIGNPTVNSQTNSPRQIARMENGRWAVLIGNGYGSDNSADNKGVPDSRVGSGGAVMYVLFLEGPTGPGNTWLPTNAGGTRDYVKIPLFDAGCGTTVLLTDDLCRGAGPNNGLGTVTPFDIDNDGNVDFLYAADLKGNLWRVDVRGPASGWSSSYRRLFSAAFPQSSPVPALVPQPVTTSVTAIAHPFGGVMVNFITGKSLAAADLADTSQQTLYGIWDRPTPYPTGVTYPLSSDRTRLVAQGTGTVLSANGNFRTGTYVNIDWAVKDGWYYDLPFAAEKGVFNVFFNDDDSLVFNTVFNLSGGAVCRADTGIVLNIVDPITGRPPERNFDTDGNGRVNNLDKIAVPSGGTESASGAILRQGVSGSAVISNPAKKPCTGAGCPTTPAEKRKRENECKDIELTRLKSGATEETVSGCKNKERRIYWREITRDGQ